jgi:hypothetical protein
MIRLLRESAQIARVLRHRHRLDRLGLPVHRRIRRCGFSSRMERLHP